MSTVPGLKPFVLSAACSAALLSTTVHAQVSEAPDNKAATIETVVVTAERREEDLQRVPAAVSAFTAKTRDLVGIKSVTDVANFTPGVSYSAGADRLSVRGVGRLTNIIGSDPGVATYSDGFYQSGTTGVNQSTLLIDRVEVLRGPQGTLYGRNSIGGAINIISARPTDTFTAEARAGIGNYGSNFLEGTVSGPLTDWLRGRVYIDRTEQDDGYFKNVGGGPSEGGAGKSLLAQVQLAADITSNFDVWLKYEYSDANTRPRTSNVVTPYNFPALSAAGTPLVPPGGFFVKPTTVDGQGGDLVPNPAYLDPTANPGASDYRDFSADTFARAHLNNAHTVVGQATWHGDGVQLKYIGGFQTFKFQSTGDLDGTNRSAYTYDSPYEGFPSPFGGIIGPTAVFSSNVSDYRQKLNDFSNELDLSSTGAGPLQWIVGLYQYHEDSSQQTNYGTPNQPQMLTPLDALTFTPAAPNASGHFVETGGTLKADAYAAFGQADYAFSDTFKITAGIRYSRDEKEGTELIRLVQFDPTIYGSTMPALDVTRLSFGAMPGVAIAANGDATRVLKGSWDGWSGVVGPEWTPDETTTVYAKYSRGYKSGGFNLGAFSPTSIVKPETVDAFEGGLKKNILDNLQANIAAYWYDYNDIQAQMPVSNGVVTFQNFVNIPRARSYGIEFETIWAPIPELQFTGVYSYLNTRIGRGCCYLDLNGPFARDPGAKPSGPPLAGAPNAQPQTLVGDQLPNAPHNQFTLNGVYTIALNDWGTLALSGTYLFHDEATYSVFNSAQYVAPSYQQVDLRATWQDEAQRWEVIAFTRNLFDEKEIDGITRNAGTSAYAYGTLDDFNPPRTFGLEVHRKFD
ncbi:MAG: TonB-dependent receptor [Rhizomicrobium sp.]